MQLFDEIYVNLKDYLVKNSAYTPIVMKIPKGGGEFPKVVVTKADDRETGRSTLGIETKGYITFEIDIYAMQKGNISELTIAQEIEEKVKFFMGGVCGFVRTFDQPTPNVDTNVYRITMRYEANVNERRNAFY